MAMVPISTDSVPGKALEAVTVAPLSGNSKRHRTPSPDAGPIKRRQIGKSEVEGDCSGSKNDAKQGQPTPPTRLEGLVWSFKRQPLCDAQAYFKSHQGGTYTKNKVIQGLLVAGSVEIRDFLGKDNLVTCCGGGRKQTKDGLWVRAASTEVPGTLKSWQNAKSEQRPVLVIIANDHPSFRDLDLSSIPKDAQYVVLGAFFVTDLWQEMAMALPRTNAGGSSNVSTAQNKTMKNKKKKAEPLLEYPVYKLKLQRVTVAEAPIYWKGDHGDFDNQLSSKIDEPYRCQVCGAESPRVFEAKELCLNSMCKDFFHEEGKQLSACDQSLQYSKTFMTSTQPFTGDYTRVPSGFQPPPINDEDGWGTEKAFRMGMVCPDCGCCNSRTHWNFWNCVNCGYIYRSEPKPYPMSEVNKESDRHSKLFLRRKQPQYQTFKTDMTTITMDDHFVSMFTNAMDQDRHSVITAYMIFNQNHQFLGSVVHERPFQAILEIMGGSNELFKEAQESMDTMKLKRNPCRCVNKTLTRHFAHNFGVLYEFGVSPDNTAFKEAPDIILKSLAQLTYFGQRAVAFCQQTFSAHQWERLEGSTIMEPWAAPNELLALAYMEDDSISYHDDGEDQLNGVISTLSLGSPAVMKLRMKKESKREESEDVTDPESKGKAQKGKNKPILEIQLRHGDVVTMCDTRLQAFTEHTVQPVGLRRYAMTSRFINTQYYNKGEPAKKLKKLNMTTDDLQYLGELPERASKFAFKGTQLHSHNSST